MDIPSDVLRWLKQAQPEVQRWVLAKLSSDCADETDDAIQNTNIAFIEAWSKNTLPVERTMWRNWLCRVAGRKAIDIMRKRKRIPVPMTEFLSQVADDEIPEELLHEAVGRLPQKLKKVVNLLSQGFKQCEIAQEIGVSEPTVSRLVNELRTALRDYRGE